MVKGPRAPPQVSHERAVQSVYPTISHLLPKLVCFLLIPQVRGFIISTLLSWSVSRTSAWTFLWDPPMSSPAAWFPGNLSALSQGLCLKWSIQRDHCLYSRGAPSDNHGTSSICMAIFTAIIIPYSVRLLFGIMTSYVKLPIVIMAHERNWWC